ncbi:ATP-binding protein [Actinomadura sp. KC216]|uniref:ATP-binding protein n=1 Tax=Actinomadura sp. KC216 TaxID=2530370 RepID=UPI0010429527|nr:ATP-binding protein [Actinomadura sp. KC216]
MGPPRRLRGTQLGCHNRRTAHRHAARGAMHMTRRRRTARFRRNPSSVPRARTWLKDQLTTLTPAPGAEVVDKALLGLSEIVTNAVEHGAGRHITVACTVIDDRMTIEALDGGKNGKLPAVQSLPRNGAEHGRGLFLLDALSDGDWEWDTLIAGRTRVRFHLRLVPDPHLA